MVERRYWPAIHDVNIFYNISYVHELMPYHFILLISDPPYVSESPVLFHFLVEVMWI
jgi:hypothetical protein